MEWIRIIKPWLGILHLAVFIFVAAVVVFLVAGGLVVLVPNVVVGLEGRRRLEEFLDSNLIRLLPHQMLFNRVY